MSLDYMKIRWNWKILIIRMANIKITIFMNSRI